MNYLLKKHRLGALLCAAMLFCAPLTGVSAAPLLRGSQNPEQSQGGGSAAANGAISVQTLRSVAADYNVPSAFLDAIGNGRGTITTNQLKAYALEYQLPAQYVQRFVTDAFVFKAGTQYQYLPLDNTLKKNNYDWNHLITRGTEKQYVVNGRQQALKGIDVSEFQGNIDWRRVKADGVDYAFIRLGYRGYGTGKINLDKYFHQNMKNAAAAGVKVGVYFYTQAVNEAEAREEANFVLDQIKGYKLDYPVALDIEDAGSSSARTINMTKQQNTDVVRAFCDTIAAAGKKPLIYANSRWFISKLDMKQLTNYDKWLAQYYVVPFFPYDFQIWQYTGAGRVDGISGNVDMNLCFDAYSQPIRLHIKG